MIVAALQGGDDSFLSKEESTQVGGKTRKAAVFKIYMELYLIGFIDTLNVESDKKKKRNKGSSQYFAPCN